MPIADFPEKLLNELRRRFYKNWFIITVNALGLGIAISCSIVAYLAYDFNTDFDGHHSQSSRIYRVNALKESQAKFIVQGYVPIPLGELIHQNVKDIETVVRFSSFPADLKIGDNLFGITLGYVDQDFFSTFSFEFSSGNPKKLADKSKIFISEALAVRLFGNINVTGKTVTQLMLGDKARELDIGGVYKIQPANSSFDQDAYVVSDNYWEEVPDLHLESNWQTYNTLFLKVKKAADIDAIKNQLKKYSEHNNRARQDVIIKEFQLDPFQGMAVRDLENKTPSAFLRKASPTYVITGTLAMSIFLFLIASFNLINSTFALSSARSREIGIRKIVGDVRFELFFSVFSEVLLICFLAGILGCFIAVYLLVPEFNQFWTNIKLDTTKIATPNLLFLASILIVVSALSALYPTLYFNKFKPSDILNGKIKIAGTSMLTKTLLVTQLGLSLLSVIGGFSFYQNSIYQRDIGVGFNQKGVVYTWVNSQHEFEVYRNALQENQFISSIASSTDHLFISTYRDKVKYEGEEIELNRMDVGDDYVKTVGLELIQGRDFIKSSETDRKESVIITKRLADEFNWDKPIGKEIIWRDTVHLYVVGVVKDIYNKGLAKQFTPMMIRYTTPDKYPFVLVSGNVKKIVEINTFMEEKWKEIFPNRTYPGRYMDREIMEDISVNNNIVKMSFFIGVVALLLSLTGLFTHLSLTITRKMKEVAVRKVLGASVTNLAWVVSKEFLITLVLASTLALTVGPYLIDELMSSTWSYYQSTSQTTLALSVAMLFLISFLTIIFKIRNAANLNATDILKEQ